MGPAFYSSRVASGRMAGVLGARQGRQCRRARRQELAHPEPGPPHGRRRLDLYRRHQPAHDLKTAAGDGEDVSSLGVHGIKADPFVKNLNRHLLWPEVGLQDVAASIGIRESVFEHVGARLVEGEDHVVNDFGRDAELFQVARDRPPGRAQQSFFGRERDVKGQARIYDRRSSQDRMVVAYPGSH
jgi:hypothetical protein